MTPLEQIEFVANKFRKLPCDFAFLGGAVLGVLITDPAAPPARTTKDVDVLVNTPTRKSYTDLKAQLRKLGFKNDTTEGAPICRWRWSEIVIDVMPPTKEVLGWLAAFSKVAARFWDREVGARGMRSCGMIDCRARAIYVKVLI